MTASLREWITKTKKEKKWRRRRMWWWWSVEDLRGIVRLSRLLTFILSDAA
jgi:hypothetical protein